MEHCVKLLQDKYEEFSNLDTSQQQKLVQLFHTAVQQNTKSNLLLQQLQQNGFAQIEKLIELFPKCRQLYLEDSYFDIQQKQQQGKNEDWITWRLDQLQSVVQDLNQVNQTVAIVQLKNPQQKASILLEMDKSQIQMVMEKLNQIQKLIQ